MKLTKVANIKDFDEKELSDVLKKYLLYNVPESAWDSISSIENYDKSLLNRKTWEMAMALLSFDKLGLLDGDKEFLGIGVAREDIISILSNHARRVFATDIYLSPETWGEWHSPDMLIDPRPYFSNTLNWKRVVFQHVNGKELPYEDESLDGVFSCSSIEHFGDESDIRRSVEEICRVLKPGGVAAISTEYRIQGESGFDNLQLFDRERLQRVWIDGLNWKALDFIDEKYCESDPIDFRRSILNQEYARNTMPHMILEFKSTKWTSVHLTLVKNS